MKCPHCLENFNDQQTLWTVLVGNDADGWWLLTRRHCPTCQHFVFAFEIGQVPPADTRLRHQGAQGINLPSTERVRQVWPRDVSRSPMPRQVPATISDDYREACLVLSDSPKASAALSRRCLQNLLRQAAGVKPGNLYDEIQQVIDSKQLPSTVADSIDAVRHIGNFAAHPVKSTVTGEIVDVEPNEAEWNLDVLESLFDFYYVLPAKAQARKDALNKKLADAGKPPVK